ncbi:MAG TPA: PilN domain-containing protein [Steroidobacteraceae bacterium]|nr:PilN domain-containing protein [Steroidobacteraceae bacterium]
MPRINLLPWREQQRTERKKAFGVGMLAAAIGAAVVAGAAFLLVNQMIDAQAARNARLQTEIKVVDRQIEEINSLEQQKQQFIARMNIIAKLQRSRPEIVHVFDTFVKTIPDGTYLTAIKQEDQKFKIQGVAQSSTRVSAFMRALDASQWLKEPELEVVETTKNNAQGNDFTLYAKQVTSLTDDDVAGKKKPGAAPRRTP